MKPIIFTIVAAVLYAIANVTIENKLSQYSTIPLLMWWYGAMLIITTSVWLVCKATNQPMVSPELGWAVAITCVVAVVYFFADFSFISAYTNGGTLFSITSIIMVFPIIAAAIKAVIDKELPNRYQVLAYVLIAGGTFIFIKDAASKAPVTEIVN